MAGPGGGSRGGGGRRGGSRSSSRSRSSRRSYRSSRSSYGRSYSSRRRYGGSSSTGCFTGIFVPILVMVILIFGMFSTLAEKWNQAASDGKYRYDENVFQDYADDRYEEAFGDSDAYEDNLLITVLVEDEEYYDFYYIAWVGDHVVTDINHMMGSYGTELGQAMDSCINEASYKYSLDSNLAQVVESLERQIQHLRLESSFSCDEDHVQVASHLTNRSRIDMNEDTVNAALASFTETTGIPAVIVVEDMDDVFAQKGIASVLGYFSSNMGAVIAVAVIAIIGWILVRKSKELDE